MDKNNTRRPILGKLDDALALVRSGDVIVTPCYANEPRAFLSRLHTVAGRVENVRLWLGNTMESYRAATDEAMSGHIDAVSNFYGKDCRAIHPSKRVSLSPSNLSATAQTIINTARPTLFVASVAPMDADGFYCMSTDLEYSLECLEAADKVVFEVNRKLPKTHGETRIPASAADLVYEAENELPYAPEIRSSEVEEAIAGYVASLIKDGDCIQLGIGGTPNAVGRALTGKRELGIHTEMITSSMGALLKAGAVTNKRKNFYPGLTIGAFAWGNQDLYDYMDGNETVVLRRCAWVNDPFIISQNDNMVSVNTALQIDLTGQICSESIGPRQYTGTGGATDFAYGAYRSKGGRGIIAIASTAKGGAISKIQPTLAPGAVVTISRNLSDYIVTEYGIARMRDRTVRQRVEGLIAISHPDFRAELRREAERLMLW